MPRLLNTEWMHFTEINADIFEKSEASVFIEVTRHTRYRQLILTLRTLYAIFSLNETFRYRGIKVIGGQKYI